MPSATVTLDGRSLTPELLVQVARTHEAVAIAAEGRDRNLRAYRSTVELKEAGAQVYGLNTGVGSLKRAAVDEDGEEHQRRLLGSHAGGAGQMIQGELVRATLAVRINQLCAGGAGVHPELLDALLRALNEDWPIGFRELGPIGTADLSPLAEIGLAILARAAPKLGPRDGLMLMSSNAATVATAALACADLTNACRAMDSCAALSFEAANANPGVLDERVHRARPHPGQMASAEVIRGALGGYAPASPRLQDSFAFRCVCQVNGALRDAVMVLRKTIATELNAAAENALLVDGAAIANGNFHALHLALALDQVRNALAHVGALIAARVKDLLCARVTGLTDFLAQNPGPDSGLMILEYTTSAAVGELRLLAHPVGGSVDLSSGVENHASFATLAAQTTRRSLWLIRTLMACELICACRALTLAGRSPRGTGNTRIFNQAREVLSSELHDRPLSADIDAATALVATL